MPETLYDVLGVEPSAPPEKIRAIYRLRSRATHPRRPGEGDPDRQRLLNEAYEILGDPNQRADYNQAQGISSKPRALRPGASIFAEVAVSKRIAARGGAAKARFTRWKTCHICWGEGCHRCRQKGRIAEEITLTVHVPPGAQKIVVDGQGAAADPGGPRGDLVLYVVPD